jgi:hypothetical protein
MELIILIPGVCLLLLSLISWYKAVEAEPGSGERVLGVISGTACLFGAYAITAHILQVLANFLSNMIGMI